MKLNVIGVNQRYGISAKSNKPYSITELSYLVPISDGEKRDEDGTLRWTLKATGFRVVSMEVCDDCLPQLLAIQYPLTVDLEIEPRPENPARNWVVGVKAK